MKPLIPILIVTASSLAVASVQFARQASAQRERAETEMTLRQKQDVRVAQLEREQVRLEGELTMARGATAGGAAGAALPGAPMPSGPRVAGGRMGGPGGGWEPREREAPPPDFFRGGGPRMMQTPAAQNFLRSRVRNSMRRMYEDAGPALGLSADKSKQLLDLLADQQTRNTGRPNIPDGQTFQQFAEAQQKKNSEEIAALVGQDKMDEWAAYQKTLPDRAQLGQVRDQLEQAGVPMTESQRTEMLAAITDEGQRNPRPAFSAGVPREDTVAQMNQWQSDYDKALLDRAKQVLNTDQYNAYKEYQDWQSEMRKSLPRGLAGQTGIARVGVMGPGGAVADSTFAAAPATPFVLSSTPAAPPPRQ